MRKRKNIPAGDRWRIFRRDGFKCQYCGSAEELVIDHGEPFSKGGEDDQENYVTACRMCNAGKRDQQIIPPAADENHPRLACNKVVRDGKVYLSQLDADWACVFKHAALSSVYMPKPETVECWNNENVSEVSPNFFCDFNCPEIGKANVVIVPLCDKGQYGIADQIRIRDAAILGYRTPTVILMGSPWFFYGVVVKERYKGRPDGFAISECFGVDKEVCASDWYPDEQWDFIDPREEFGLRPHCITSRGWWMSPEEAFLMAIKESRHDI